MFNHSPEIFLEALPARDRFPPLGLTYTADLTITGDSAFLENPFAITCRKIEQSFPTILEGTAFLLECCWSACYYHWMVDTLPKLDFLAKVGISWNQIDHIVLSAAHSPPFQDDCLRRLDIPHQKIRRLDTYQSIRCQQAWVPSELRNGRGVSSATASFLRKNFLVSGPPTKRQRRLYLSRDHSYRRRVRNEEALCQTLGKFGFERVFPEHLSVSDQAQLFNSAEVVIGPHGAGFTNIVFCEPDTQIIELFPETYGYKMYQFWSNILDLQYSSLTFPGLPSTLRDQDENHAPSLHCEDIEVHLDQLAQHLSQIGIF